MPDSTIVYNKRALMGRRVGATRGVNNRTETANYPELFTWKLVDNADRGGCAAGGLGAAIFSQYLGHY